MLYKLRAKRHQRIVLTMEKALRSVRLMALTAAFMACSGVAYAGPSGFASIGAGLMSYGDEYSDERDSGTAVEAAASGVFAFTPELGVQGDVAVHYYTADYGIADVKTTELDGALHGFFRNDAFLLGAFVQAGKSDVAWNGGEPHDWGRGYVGVEAQAYFDSLTLYGKLGASKVTMGDTPGAEGTSWFADIELRYFVTDNLRLEAHAGTDVTSFNYDANDLVTYKLGVGAEYKFDDSPLSVFGSLDYQSSDIDTYGQFDSVRAMVGVKFNFGDDTLKARDRTGPSLEMVEPSPLYSGST